MTTNDWIGTAWLVFLFGYLTPFIIVTGVMEQLPRGFRWLLPACKAIYLKMRHLFFRVLYPERMDENRWNHRGCHCKKCVARRKAQTELAELEQLDRQYREGRTEWNGGMWTSPSKRVPVTSGPCLAETVEHEGPLCTCVYDAA